MIVFNDGVPKAAAARGRAIPVRTVSSGRALQSFFAGGPTKKGFSRPNRFIRAGLTHSARGRSINFTFFLSEKNKKNSHNFTLCYNN